MDKLTASLAGAPLVAHALQRGLEAGLDPIVVVTGGPETGAYQALEPFVHDGSPVERVVNPEPARGLASSLRTGVAALPPEIPAAVVLLGDMPWIRPGTVQALVQAFRKEPGAAAVPVHQGRRGNPVLWPAPYFDALGALDGDRGARTLLEDPRTPVREVAVDDPGIHRDVDTAEDVKALDG